MVETLQTLRQILELGWPAIVLIMLLVLWRSYDNRVAEHIRDLRYIASIRHDLPSDQWDTPQRRTAPTPAKREPVPLAAQSNARDDPLPGLLSVPFGWGMWGLASASMWR